MSYPGGYDTPNRPFLLGLRLVYQLLNARRIGRSGRTKSSVEINNPGPVGGVERPQIPTGIAWLNGPIRGIGVGVDSQFLEVGCP